LGKSGVETEVGPVKKRRQFGKAERQSVGGSRTHGDVTELAARAWSLSVQVQMRIGNGQNVRRFRKIANQVDHGTVTGWSGGAERKAEDRAQMVFELAGDRPFDGPVAGIVNARRHFVSEEAALVLEKLDGQHADVLQRLENATGNVFGGALDRRIE
jgi:hypothetical protein